MLWAGETTQDIKKTDWQGLFSEVIGRYPIWIGEIGENKAGYKGRLNRPKNWLFDVGMQRYLMSHTSYEFGNPYEPFQKPLSRLEFPLNTWWLDFRLRRTCPRWSLGGRAGLSVARNIDGRMKDSDWDDPENTGIKTVYSESALRAEANYLFRTDVDVNISDWLGLPSSFEIRPLFAFEFQRLSLMAHDTIQWSITASPRALPGDGLHFRQDYYLYQIGLKGSYDGFKIGKYIDIKLYGEADWGPALGYNEDHHLLREGDRFTYEKTSGSGLYFAAGLDIVMAKTITAGITIDYLWIRTTGVHRHSNIPLAEDLTWPDGVRVWSDQTSLVARLSYAF
jgi:outer membrane protease